MRKGLLLIVVLFALCPVLTSAALVTITAVVQGPEPPPPPPDTVVTFRGIAYPQSQVTIQRNGAVLVTVPADPSAHFDVTLKNQQAGIASFDVFAEDAQGRVGRTSSFTISITAGTTTTVTGIFLGPTIQVNGDSFKASDTVTMLGATAPSSAVTIFVSSEEEQTFNVNADASGLWTLQKLGSDLGSGAHTAKAKAVAPSNEISGFSSSVSFAVNAADVCDTKNVADINCDGKVNLTDFSILLFYWKQKDPANARADINHDRVVNLTDLSILLFNWSK